MFIKPFLHVTAAAAANPSASGRGRPGDPAAASGEFASSFKTRLPFMENPNFDESYTHRRTGVFSARSVLENIRVEPTKVVSMVGKRHFRIIGSCNGLLCLIHVRYDPHITSAILWNPCTGFTSQPTPDITGVFVYGGLGYDRTSDRYKLFMMTGDHEKRERSKIYTFAPNSSWKTIQGFDFRLLGHPRDDPCPIDEDNQEGVFVNGRNTLNWNVQRYRSTDVIISLDLGEESFGILSLPERDPYDRCIACVELSLLRNCLAVCFEHKRTHWAVWIMKEYGVTDSWTRLALIPRQGVNPRHSHCLRPLYISENDVLLAMAPYHKLVLCDLKNDDANLVPVIENFGDDMEEEDAISRYFQVYWESLVSPSSHYDIASSSSQGP
ncbi:hypothetical protein PIB30_094686 [Stylosanthes scabra]|uniref:F-box associated beta-propeller type 1 domain-containing protein n=1 Tax=Stylosanthes scabra TaxID=79078 RepID=A0ABU6QVG6_9FABA|nr:hypothetical protein [Stylosanthes scabra]